MTDLIGNFSALFDNLPEMSGDAIAAATGIDKNTLMMGAGTLLAVGTGAVLLFRHRRHTQATLKAQTSVPSNPGVEPTPAKTLEPAPAPAQTLESAAPELPAGTPKGSAASSSSSHSQDDEPAEQQQYGSDDEVVYRSDDELSERSKRLKARNNKK